MPAPLAKGPGVYYRSRSSSSSSSRTRHMPSPTRLNPLLTSGIIIAASVLVAAGIAIYESPQVRQWVDQSRRKIALALHSLGDDIHPRRPSESSDDFEERKRRREELIRRNRNELVRRAREEGVAVDLDELARIGRDEVEMTERRATRGGRTNSAKSFDDLVGSDGMLKKDAATTTTTTGTDTADKTVRRRGMAGFAAGTAAGVAMANPFADDMLLDNDTKEAPSPKEFIYTEPGTRESSATLEASTPAPVQAPLIDLTPESEPPLSGPPQVALVADPEVEDLEQAAQSFYSFSSSSPSPYNSTHFTSATAPIIDAHDHDADVEEFSTGTLTPRSERSAFTGASTVGSHADDIAILSMQNDDDHDTRSEAFSEGGFTEEGFSEAGFSEVESQRGVGVMTPSSWTDVGSDDESDWGGPANNGHVSQIQH